MCLISFIFLLWTPLNNFIYGMPMIPMSYEDLKQLNVSCYPKDSCSADRSENSLEIQPFSSNTCSCGRLCSQQGTCCIDSRYKDATPTIRETCRTVNMTGVLQMSEGYFMVDRCIIHSGSNNPEWKNLCQEEWNGENDVLKLIPVTSLYTFKTYKNYYCFRCHETTDDFLYWEVSPEGIFAEEPAFVREPEFGTYTESDKEPEFGTSTESHRAPEFVTNTESNKEPEFDTSSESHNAPEFDANTKSVKEPEFGSKIEHVEIWYDMIQKTWMAPRGKEDYVPVTLKFRIPSFISSIPIKCDPDVITSCIDADINISNKCNAYMAIIGIKKGDTVIKYKNAHCALCNFENLDDMTCNLPLADYGEYAGSGGYSGGGAVGYRRRRAPPPCQDNPWVQEPFVNAFRVKPKVKESEKDVGKPCSPFSPVLCP